MCHDPPKTWTFLKAEAMAASTRRRIPNYFLYGEAPRAHDERTLHVEPIEARSARHHWRIDAHQHHSLNQLVLVLKGRGVTVAEGHVAHFEPPALALVPSGTVHGFEFEPHTLGLVVTIADEVLSEFARREPALDSLFQAPLTLELPRASAQRAPLLRAARQLAREHAESGAARTLALEGALALFLAEVLRAAQSITPAVDSPQSRHRELTARFRAAIETAFRNNVSIPQYARQLKVSESQLRSACIEATGQPPIHLVHARILLEAKRQLFHTNRPVSEIAYALGFEDPAYFTRFFARRAGISPRAFRARSSSIVTG